MIGLAIRLVLSVQSTVTGIQPVSNLAVHVRWSSIVLEPPSKALRYRTTDLEFINWAPENFCKIVFSIKRFVKK